MMIIATVIVYCLNWIRQSAKHNAYIIPCNLPDGSISKYFILLDEEIEALEDLTSNSGVWKYILLNKFPEVLLIHWSLNKNLKPHIW